MRGTDRETGKLFSYASPESLVPQDHPLRAIRALVNAALERRRIAILTLIDAHHHDQGQELVMVAHHILLRSAGQTILAGVFNLRRRESKARGAERQRRGSSPALSRRYTRCTMTATEKRNREDGP
jgi:hypothetical protein